MGGGRKDDLEFSLGELGNQQKDVTGLYLERITLLQEDVAEVGQWDGTHMETWLSLVQEGNR